MIEIMFELKFNLINTKNPDNYIYSSNCTAENIDEAIKFFKKWHKQNRWNSEWISITDFANNNTITFKKITETLDDYLTKYTLKDFSYITNIKTDYEIPLKRVFHPTINPYFDKNKTKDENIEILKKHNEEVITKTKIKKQKINEINDEFKQGLLLKIVEYSQGKINLRQAKLIYEKIKINPFNINDKKDFLIKEIDYIINILKG